MSAQAQPAHDHKLAKLLVRHGQAMGSGDYRRALAINQQLVSLSGSDGGDFPALDAAAIFAPLEPIKYLVQSLDLCPGAPTMIAGYGYSRKTMAAQSLALSIAANLGTVWGCFRASGGNVAHLDYEQGPRLSRDRYQRLAVPHMIGPADLAGRLSLISMPTRYLDQPGVEIDLARVVDGYSLAIVDSLRASAPHVDENSSEVRRVLDGLTRVSEKTGCAFVVIHHARKPQKEAPGGAKMTIRGSGALFDACASVLVFEGEKGEPTRVSHEKARVSGILTDDFDLNVSDIEDGGNPRAGLLVTASAALSREAAADESAKAARRARTSKLRDEVRQLFEREPEQGGMDSIAEKLNRKPADVRSAIKAMMDDGLIGETGKTKNKRLRWLGRE